MFKIKAYLTSVLAVLLFTNPVCAQNAPAPDELAWQQLPNLLKQITKPEFPDKTYNILNFGAIADGKTDCTKAINAAIDSCSNAGGGMVLVPAGSYFSAAIHLKSNVNLHLEENAEIKFSLNPNDYLPLVLTRFEGIECYNYSPLVYAYNQKNIAITGKGTLNGQADSLNWWPWKGPWKGRTWTDKNINQLKAVDTLFKMGEAQTPVNERVFGNGHYLRPDFIQFHACENVLVEDITINNSPMWIIHPLLSKNVTIHRVKVISHGPNNDGCNPESSYNVLIQDCYFDTGDDCIAIKSGRNTDGRRVNIPSENIIIRGCTMKDGHGGVVMGSEISGSCRNVFAEDCYMDSPNLDRILRFKSNSIRGGTIENVYMRNITAGAVKEAIVHVDLFYGEGDVGNFPPKIKNVYVRNVKSKSSDRAIFIKAYERSPVENLFIENCTFNGVNKENLIQNVQNMVLNNVYINDVLVK